MTTTNATATHDFAIAYEGAITFISVEEGDIICNWVTFRLDSGAQTESLASVEWARKLYSQARESGRLLSTEAAQSVVDGDAALVRLTQKGRSFFRAVKGSPFRYAKSCEARSGVLTGYDVCTG